MDFRWITDDHVHALIEAVHVADEPYRSRLREVLVSVNAWHADALAQAVTESIAVDDVPFRKTEDILMVERLLNKGLMHNGVVPTMAIPEVARAADLIAHTIARIRQGTLTFEEQSLLEWVFDQGANAYEQANFFPVRDLEQSVRNGLGLVQRLAFLPEMPDDIA